MGLTGGWLRREEETIDAGHVRMFEQCRQFLREVLQKKG